MFRIVFVLLLACGSALAQPYTASAVFAHNDYAQPVPFYLAYAQQVGYIEADIFLQNNTLLVAHTKEELDAAHSLEELYLKPLDQQIARTKGLVYGDAKQMLTLMIDLKTNGEATLPVLVKTLKRYPKLIACQNLQITVSGDMPAPARWDTYPTFIHFDGRPDITYTDAQWQRVAMISTGFTDQVEWNGKGIPTAPARAKIEALMKAAHSRGKKLRFWATPDFENAWLVMMDMKVDILNTDRVTELTTFLKKLPANTYHNPAPHSVYTPAAKAPVTTAKPKNVILLIGDGMGLTQLYTGYTTNQGSLNVFQIRDIGLSITAAADNYITDSAAGATAMATGQKTRNRYISVDTLGNPLPSLTVPLKKKNFRTAIITAGDVTDATPACFYAHQPERSMSQPIALDFMNTNNDILIGGGFRHFTERKDGKNLLTELKQQGYTVSGNFKDLDTIRNNRFVVLDDGAVVSKQKGRGDFLTRSLQKSLAAFTPSDKPFFIMAEGAQIDWGGHANNLEYVAREMLDFDQTIGEALKFADKNGETLIIITADHETGGLSLLGGNVAARTIRGNFSTGDHTSVPVPVFAYGPGAEQFRGVYQNTEICRRICALLGVTLPE